MTNNTALGLDTPSAIPGLAAEALRLGYEFICGGDCAAFVVVECSRGKQHLVKVQSKSGRVDAGLLETARQLIGMSFRDARQYAVVWDGYLRSGRSRKDAVFVEFGQRGESESLIYAQPYRPGSRRRAARQFGNPVQAAARQSLFITARETRIPSKRRSATRKQ